MATAFRIVVATFLTRDQQDRVNGALTGHVELLSARSWAELIRLVRTRPVTVVILNPAADGVTDIQPAAELLRKYPSVSVIMYVILDRASLDACVRLSKRGLDEIILQSIDDSRDRLRAIIDAIGSNPRMRYVLRILQPGLGRLPIELGSAVEDLFLAPHKYKAVHDLAMKSRISTLRLYGEFDHAGLASPKRLIIAAKLLHACRYLHDADQSVAIVASKVGYEHPRSLVQHSLQVFGVTPSRLRSELRFRTFHRKMLLWLRPAANRRAKAAPPHLAAAKRRRTG